MRRRRTSAKGSDEQMSFSYKANMFLYEYFLRGVSEFSFTPAPKGALGPWGAALAFFTGAALASFAAAAAGRTAAGVKWWGRERSVCLSCGRELKWYELVPVISYLALGGKCGGCGARIPTELFFMELWGGVLVCGSYISSGAPAAAVSAALAFLFVFQSVSDIHERVLYDWATFAAAAAGLAGRLAAGAPPAEVFAEAAGAACCAVALSAPAAVKNWLGWGDVLLLAALAALLGPKLLLPSVFLASAAASAWAGASWVYDAARGVQGAGSRRYLAFGPFLCFAASFLWLFSPLATAVGVVSAGN